MLAVLAPGQGAQTPGMLAPWLELPGAADTLAWYSAITGLDLISLGTEADAETIRDTAIAQPLLTATALLAADHLDLAHGGVGVVAGHSVGEFAAAAIAGALSYEAALVLVRERGAAMAQASAAEPTGMSAVLGGDPDAVRAHLVSLGLTAANENGAGQVVAAGLLADLARLGELPPEGARVRPLSVAGAFHTRFMEPARQRLAALAAGVPVRDPQLTLISNADGAVVGHGRDVVDRLVAQVANPVRWDTCQTTLAQLGITALIELPPAGTLVGLAKRTLPDVEVLAVKGPDDLEAAERLLARHRMTATEPAPAWRIVVAPVAGIFRPDSIAEGTLLGDDVHLGHIDARNDTVAVPSGHGGVLVEWLAEAGDPVSPGQPLARLHPEGVHL